MNSFMYLLDTNIVSELSRQFPDKRVEKLVISRKNLSAIPAVVWGECLFGLKRLPDSKKKEILLDFYLNAILSSFRFIPFDDHAASVYSDIKSRLQKVGKPASELDMQIAATAIANNAILITRNTKDFQYIEQVSALMVENWFTDS